MLSRISSIFFKREENLDIDIKDLLVQIRNLPTEEKQLVRNTLDESVVTVPPTDATVPLTGVTYEYKTEPYKKRGD